MKNYYKPGKNTAGNRKNSLVYFDCYYGISGDMALGALLDCGVPLKDLRIMLAGLKLGGFCLDAETVYRGGIAATRALVRVEQDDTTHRGLSDILSIIEQSDLPGVVRDNSSAVFENLARAESGVHGTEVESVHFHEVGALDAIVDIVGTCAALYLAGADYVYSSPLPAGRGVVESAHGRLPLPAPATLQLLTRRKVPVEGRDCGYELVTPTGAALVTTLACDFGPIPEFVVEQAGYGAGSIDPGYANYLRVIRGFVPARLEEVGPQEAHREGATLIEANIDDLNPEIYGYLMDKLFIAGALDVYYTPVQMKKNRPGVQLTVVATPDSAGLLQKIIFAETTTLGLRLTGSVKVVRPREFLTLQTDWGPIRVKYTPESKGTYPLHHSPEFEDCRRVAMQSNLPLKEIYRIVERLFRERF